MGKRGTKPQGKVKLDWSADLSYVIGLITADGSLSSDGRHIDITSVDLEQVENIRKCLNLSHIKIGTKIDKEKRVAYRIQFGDVNFYKFLESLGLKSNKSKTLQFVMIPTEYFNDFLRGLFDGDGCTYSYYDKRWKNSFMLYLSFCSASEDFINWLQKEIYQRVGVSGRIIDGRNNSRVFQLKYAKKEGLMIIKYMYRDGLVFLSRKKLKINKSLAILGETV